MKLTQSKLRKLILEAIQEEISLSKSGGPCRPEEIKAGTCADEYRVGDYLQILVGDYPEDTSVTSAKGPDADISLGQQSVGFIVKIEKVTSKSNQFNNDEEDVEAGEDEFDY